MSVRQFTLFFLTNQKKKKQNMSKITRIHIPKIDKKICDIYKIADFVSKSYGIDLTKGTRKRTYAYARKVFCKIAYGLGYGQSEIIHFIGGNNDDVVLHHVGTFSVINAVDLMIYNACIDEFNLPLQKYPNTRSISHNQSIDIIANKLLELNNKELKYFEQEILERFMEWKDKDDPYLMIRRF